MFLYLGNSFFKKWTNCSLYNTYTFEIHREKHLLDFLVTKTSAKTSTGCPKNSLFFSSCAITFDQTFIFT